MDEVLYISILKTTAIVASVAGILIGLDLIFGARITFNLRRILEKTIDFDAIIKRKLEKPLPFDFDKLIASSKVKIFLGIIFLGLALVIFLLIRKV